MKKTRGLFGLIGAAAAVASAFSSLRSARSKKDSLAITNAGLSFAVAITGAALAIRAIRKGKKA